MPIYHWRDEWMFERGDDGNVIIHNTRLLERHLVIPPNEWASIIASVSAKGETGEQFSAAEAFHG